MPRLSPCVLIFLLSCLLFSGCGRGPVADESQGDSFAQLNVIQQCYLKYATSNNKPPASAKDLKQLLLDANQDLEKVFISSSDGKPFVVHWGATSSPTSRTPTVIAYEVVGKNGQRMVMTSMGVMAMSEKEFTNSTFPEGFSLPTSPSN